MIGAVLATAGLAALVYAVMRPSGQDALPPLFGGLALLGIFLLHQAKWATDPLLPLEVFRLRSVSSGNLVMFLLGLGFFASPVLLSLYLQDVHGYSPLQAGLAYLPIGFAMFCGAQTAGALSVRLGVRRAAVLCCLLGGAGFAGVAALIGVHASYLSSVLLPGILLGFGTAAAFTPITISATGGVPPRHNGLAAGLLNTVRQTSGAIGLAALTAAIAWEPGAEALAHGYAVAFTASAACLAVAAGIAALTMPRR